MDYQTYIQVFISKMGPTSFSNLTLGGMFLFGFSLTLLLIKRDQHLENLQKYFMIALLALSFIFFAMGVNRSYAALASLTGDVKNEILWEGVFDSILHNQIRGVFVYSSFYHAPNKPEARFSFRILRDE